jgi:hypothetical protein
MTKPIEMMSVTQVAGAPMVASDWRYARGTRRGCLVERRWNAVTGETRWLRRDGNGRWVPIQVPTCTVTVDGSEVQP